MSILLLGFAVMIMAIVSAVMGFGALQTGAFLIICAILIVIYWPRRHKERK